MSWVDTVDWWLVLPDRLGTRGDCADILRAQVPDTLASDRVAVICAHVQHASPGFLDELVKGLFLARRAHSALLVDVPPAAERHIHEAASRRGRKYRFRVVDTGPTSGPHLFERYE